MIVFDQENDVDGRRPCVIQGISLAASVGLPGLEIFDVALEDDGSWTWHVTAAGGDEAPVCCPSCGGESTRRTEPVIQQLKHLVVVPVEVAWHKWRWRCGDTGCGRSTFTRTGPLAVPGGRVNAHAGRTMGHLVGDWLVPVSRVAAGTGVAWHTAHEGVAQVAADAGIVVTDTKTPARPGPAPMTMRTMMRRTRGCRGRPFGRSGR